ncbi:hypothetical protein SCHPADRAFT_882944 [Schizopora paradoxa]|uniref:Signal recognition particle subunit SRP68 n=1 Tax=Schizopora paradoxa TaxID=27342 RepID=A0A0H2R3E6_9AGAM|nr:hypothetical protein SCHPADRAFT_882944 [Schizopora paradoxa]
MAIDQAQTSKVNFKALLIANEHRSAYGLRYNDFSRYRKHCANRTHRLRSTLKMTHGKGREFKKLPVVTPENLKDGHLQLLLFETERAWAYSQELQAEALKPTNSAKVGTLRHSSTARFRRAIHWCTQLLSHCQSLHASQRLSAKNMVEVTAYTLMLSGKFLRYRDEYQDSLEQLCVTRDLLDKLAETADSSRNQALATLFADEISPEIRYCAHQLGHTKSYEVDAIVKELSPKHRGTLVQGYDRMIKKLYTESQTTQGDEGGRVLQPLIWDGQEVPIRNPELVDVLLQVQKAEAALKAEGGAQGEGKMSRGRKSRKGVASFDAVLAALSDAEDVTRKLVETQQNTSAATSSTGARDIHFVHSYIVYHLLSRRIQRDLTLVSALVAPPTSRHPAKGVKAPQADQQDARVNPAVVKILDTVLQSLTQMRALTVVEENPYLTNAVEARLAFTKSRRCLFLARSYAAVKQYAQAMALIQRSKLYIRESSTHLVPEEDPINAIDNAFFTLGSESISALEKTLTEDEEHVKQDWFAYNGGTASASRDPTKKPLFFNIALNYVQLDMDRLQERAGAKPSAPVVKNVMEPKLPAQVTKAKAEEISRPTTPEPSGPARAGLSSLLGGWWGRK